jgi:Zn-dependent protease with chaperone function
VIEFDAILFDGVTSARRPVRVRAEEGSILIEGGGVLRSVALDEVTIDARIGNLTRTLQLPGGASLQTDAHDALAILLPRSNRFESWVQGMERRWPYVLGGLAVIILLSWGFVVQGLPWAAAKVARHIPPAVENVLGEKTLQIIDGQFCEPSKLDPEHQQALQTALFTLTDGLTAGHTYRLALRYCKGLGANAFALPGGIIVVTDDLVKLAKNDFQTSAVMAHEIGHVELRHGLRSELQGAGVAILVTALAGDAVSVTTLAVALPTLLLQTGYSRQFETEADDYAFARLKEKGQSPRQFAEMMELLETAHQQRAGNALHHGKVLDYMSTHPVTADRIAHAMAAAQ